MKLIALRTFHKYTTDQEFDVPDAEGTVLLGLKLAKAAEPKEPKTPSPAPTPKPAPEPVHVETPAPAVEVPAPDEAPSPVTDVHEAHETAHEVPRHRRAYRRRDLSPELPVDEAGPE